MLQFAVIAKILQGWHEEVPKKTRVSMVSFSICLVGFLLDLLLDQIGRHFFQFIHFVLQGHDELLCL